MMASMTAARPMSPAMRIIPSWFPTCSLVAAIKGFGSPRMCSAIPTKQGAGRTPRLYRGATLAADRGYGQFRQTGRISGGVDETDGFCLVPGSLAEAETAIDETATQGEADSDGGDGRRIADLSTVVGEQLVVEPFHGGVLWPEEVKFLGVYPSGAFTLARLPGFASRQIFDWEPRPDASPAGSCAGVMDLPAAGLHKAA